jgi:opacity protein-like surface antigen
MTHPSLAALGVALLALGANAPATAADFYAAGDLRISSGEGEASGSTSFFDISGGDEDSSPAYGGALGFAFGLDELKSDVSGAKTPGWDLRFELEGIGGRDYELLSDGADGYFSQVDAWSLMANSWLEIPLDRPFSGAFGRLPVLRPFRLYAGGGIGLAHLDVATTDNVSRGAAATRNFSYQVGAGIAYSFTEWASLSLGWRYQDLGDIETELFIAPDQPAFGRHALDVSAHEFVTSLRIHFYSAPLDEIAPKRWSLPSLSNPFRRNR